MAGPIIYRQVATLLANSNSVGVTLDHSFPSANYAVSVEIPYQTSWWITNKTGSGFTLNVGTQNGYDQTINFIILYE